MPHVPRISRLLHRLSPSLCVLALLATAAPRANAAPEEVTYLLPSAPNVPAFAPWMIALQQGYYADENIKVTFVAGRGGVDVAKQIGAGNVLIGGAIGDTPIIVRGNGVPVKAVAVLGAGSLTNVMVRNDSPVKSIKDLKGKTVTVLSYSDTTYYAFQGSLKKAGMTKNDLDVQAVGVAGVWQLFVAGKADAMAGVPERAVSAEDAGVPVRMLPEKELFQSMAQAILASDTVIKEKPDLIRRLVRATLRGMDDIMKDPKAAARVYVKAVPAFEGKEASIERIFTLYNKYVYDGQKPLGKIDSKRLAQVQDFYVQEGIVQKAIPLADLYTNQFIGLDR